MRKLPKPQRHCFICGDYMRTVGELVEHIALNRSPHADLIHGIFVQTGTFCPCGKPDKLLSIYDLHQHFVDLLKLGENLKEHFDFHLLGLRDENALKQKQMDHEMTEWGWWRREMGGNDAF